MVHNKRCGETRMKCKGDYCDLPFENENEYKWMQEINKVVESCMIYPQQIEADNATSTLYYNVQSLGQCKAEDEQCKLKNGILIWKKDIIKECPYELVKTMKMTNMNDIYISESESQLFQATGKLKICKNIEAIQTAEGFLLTEDENAFRMSKSHNEIKTVDGLILSEMDYGNFELLQTMTKLNKVMNQKFCQLYRSFISVFAKLDDEFFIFNDLNGNEAILYSDMSRVFVPSCVLINEIDVIEKTDKCYKDIAVRVKINNETINAYLTTDKIIKTTSKVVACVNNDHIIHLKATHRIIIRRGNSISIEKDDKFTHLKLNILHANITKMNYRHDEIIINSIDIIKQVANISKQIEPQGDYHILDSFESQTTNILSDLHINLNEKINKLKYIVSALVSTVATFIIGIMVIVCICKARYRRELREEEIALRTMQKLNGGTCYATKRH